MQRVVLSTLVTLLILHCQSAIKKESSLSTTKDEISNYDTKSESPTIPKGNKVSNSNLKSSLSKERNSSLNSKSKIQIENEHLLKLETFSRKPRLEKKIQVATDYYPKQICFHPTRKEIYVTNLGNHENPPYSQGSLQIFDLETGALLFKEDAKAAVECLVDEKNPNLLYYTDMFRDEVVKFDIPNRQVLWRAKIKPDSISNIPGHEYRFMPKIVHKDPDSNRLFVSLWLDGVSIIDDTDGNLIRHIPKFCSHPRGLLYRDKILHVMCYGIGGTGVGEIVWLDPDSQVILKRFKTGGSPRHIIPYKDNLALISNLNSSEVWLYEITTGNILKSIKSGSPNTIVLDISEKYLYISDRTRNQLLILDLESWSIVDKVPVGRFPTGLGTSSDGKYLSITNFHDGNYDLFQIHNNNTQGYGIGKP